jgi:hypothetical protein
MAWVLLCFFLLPLVYAKKNEDVVVTVLTASNEGSDFNMENDEYRDRLIQLFSYRSYNQINKFVVTLNKAERNIKALIDGYELVLTLQEQEKERVVVQALIRKEGAQYVNTVLSIMKEGVVFLGGPMTAQGALILVLERF